ncbi:MAG: hypothetical protein ABIH47_04940, partial [Candidatus Omnitrophota bacterium]
DVLVINDAANVIAVNVYDGSFVWSMANEGVAFNAERQLLDNKPDNFLCNYGISRSYLRHIKQYIHFVGNQLIIYHNGTFYSINPITGYCGHMQKIDLGEAIIINVFGDHIYIISVASTELYRMVIYDKNFSFIKSFPLVFIKDKEDYPERCFLEDTIIVLQCKRNIYFIDVHKSALKNRINCQRKCFAKIYNNILIVAFFKKIVCYQIVNKTSYKRWEYPLTNGDGEQIIPCANKGNRNHCFIRQGKMLFPIQKRNEYFLAAIDLATGKEAWRTKLNAIEKNLNIFSNCIYSGANIFFIASTMHSDNRQHKDDNAHSGIGLCYIESRLYGISMSNGEIIQNIKLYSTSSKDLQKYILLKTKKYFLYNINNNYIYAKKDGTFYNER